MENEKNLNESQEEVVSEEVKPVEEAVPAEEAPAAEIPAEEKNAEEAAPAEASEQDVPAEEAVSAEGVPAEEEKTEEKKATPGKMALVIGAIVVVIAVIIALLMGGTQAEVPVESVETAPVETTEPVPTIPADGNPNDETCKGTYTVTDDEIVAAADTVVATIGEHKLTNGQLQTFYWMQVQSFLNSQYGSVMMSYGMLDYTQPLDMQVCAMTGSGSWQQFFLKEALNTWQNYCVLAENAAAAGMELTEEEKAFVESIEENLTLSAQQYGLSGVEELLKYNVGAGATLEDYTYFQELLIRGNKFYDQETAKINPTQEELEKFYAEHKDQYTQSGITEEGKYVDVRHVLFVPEGGTTDENGATVYTDAEWAACEAKAQDIMNAWTKGECDEMSFAAMAAAYSQDPGSKDNGGLYENVQQGQMVPEFDSWCFDEKRAPGHYGIVKTTYGYHLMYFVGSTPIWEYYSRQDLVAEQTNAMMEKLTSEHPMEVDYKSISLGYVNMGA